LENLKHVAGRPAITVFAHTVFAHENKEHKKLNAMLEENKAAYYRVKVNKIC